MSPTVSVSVSISVFVLALALGACDPDALGSEAAQLACDEARPRSVALPLAHAEAWTPSPAGADPLPSHQPAQVICLPEGWGEEFGVFEVSTASCNYASFEQALAEELEPGERVRVELWWSALLAPSPATAHLALLIDGELLWEQEVGIPGPAEARVIEIESPLRAPAGATLTFHLHNHGQNSWTLAAVDKLVDACPE